MWFFFDRKIRPKIRTRTCRSVGAFVMAEGGVIGWQR